MLSQVTDAKIYGVQSFYIPMKMLESLMGSLFLESLIDEGVLRVGVFTTFFGDFIYDYGIFGAVVFCFLFAFLIGAVAREVRRGNTNLLLFYILFNSFLPFLFVLNIMGSASGQYALINSFILSVILLSRKFRLAP